jgi:uncharacterized SAM-dependent methyltransferase
MYRPDIYDKAISQDNYYPFKMERDLIIQKEDQICKSIQDVTQAIEFGPGSSTPMKYKTIPFLKALEQVSSFGTYISMDSNLVYAEQACELIKREFKLIKTEAIEIDFLTKQGFEKTKCNWATDGKKLIFAFGQSIFSNNNYEDISKVLNNIANFLRDGDYLLFGADTNRDESMLEAAYNSKVVHDLLLNTMYHLQIELNPEGFKPEQFDSIYKWNRTESTVEHYLKPSVTQTLKIGNQEIIIRKNQEFNILNSRKMNINIIESFLNKENIMIKEILTLDNCQHKMFSIIIAQKVL